MFLGFSQHQWTRYVKAAVTPNLVSFILSTSKLNINPKNISALKFSLQYELSLVLSWKGEPSLWSC